MAFASLGLEKAKKGGNWQYKIYFDPEADNGKSAQDDIQDEELKDLVGTDEDIENVWAYKVPLTEKQLTKILLFHMFIVFETKRWYWSIEKHSDGITIQRSRKLSAVKERLKQCKRNSDIYLMKEGKGNMNVYGLIDWLYESDELSKSYNYLSKNCKHFANAVFSLVSKTKKQ